MLSTRSLELLDYISFAILSLLQPYTLEYKSTLRSLKSLLWVGGVVQSDYSVSSLSEKESRERKRERERELDNIELSGFQNIMLNKLIYV